jgi:cytochrome c
MSSTGHGKDPLAANKIFGGILSAALLLFGAKTFADIAWHEPKAAKPGHVLPVTVAAAGGGGAAASAFDFKAIEDGLKKVAASNVEAGKDVFKKCAACHTVNKGGDNRVGPNLWATIGRKVGAHPGFAYSDAVKAKGGDWTYQTFAQYIWDPRGAIPGNKMAFAGVQDNQDMVDLMAYMRTLDDTPKALPQ